MPTSTTYPKCSTTSEKLLIPSNNIPDFLIYIFNVHTGKRSIVEGFTRKKG